MGNCLVLCEVLKMNNVELCWMKSLCIQDTFGIVFCINDYLQFLSNNKNEI